MGVPTLISINIHYPDCLCVCLCVCMGACVCECMLKTEHSSLFTLFSFLSVFSLSLLIVFSFRCVSKFGHALVHFQVYSICCLSDAAELAVLVSREGWFKQIPKKAHFLTFLLWYPTCIVLFLFVQVLRYTSLRFLLPLQFNGDEWNHVYGTAFKLHFNCLTVFSRTIVLLL